MFGTQNLWVFLVSGIALNITPGQDTFHILARSMAQGRRAGFLAVAGIICGCSIHTLAAAFGISALLGASAHAFRVVKLLGAAYLVSLGLRMVFSRSPDASPLNSVRHDGNWGIFRGGFFSNLFNPKTALFFLAFLPQFVAPDALHKIPALLFLGGLFMTTGTLWCLALVLFASALTRQLRENPSAGTLLQRSAGALFVGLGAKLAVGR